MHSYVVRVADGLYARADMSWAIAVYLGVGGLAWFPSSLLARRVTGGGRVERIVTGAVIALGWPLTLPLLAAPHVRSRPARPRLRLVQGGAQRLTARSPSVVGADR